MKLYRFSPIRDKEELIEVIEYLHMACHKLCHQVLGEYLPVAGNMGIFCHYEDEFERLIGIRDELTDSDNNWNDKYYRLLEPITVPAKDGIPGATYTYLYIRRADPYRGQVGDADFVLQPDKFKLLKQSLLAGKKVAGVRTFDRPGLDMVELYDPDLDVLSYVHAHTMEDNLRQQHAIPSM